MAISFMAGQALAAECTDADFAASVDYTTALAKKKTTLLDDKGAATHSYVLKGDEVIVTSREGNKACVTYASVKGGASGWVPMTDLTTPNKPPNDIASWTGRFERDELGSYITLTACKGGKILASGLALWAMSLENAKNGGANEGDMEGEGAPNKGLLHIDGKQADGNDCSVDLRLLSRHYLIATNERIGTGGKAEICWGHNVRFEGLYVRVKK